MALPKEPRQKMINLMYLVLTALLALNVSAEILNAFMTVNNSLSSASTTIEEKNKTVFSSFDSLLADSKTQERARIWKPYADQAKQLADATVAYLQSLQMDLKKASGYDPKTGEFQLDELEEPTRLLADPGVKGNELLKKLTDFKNSLLAISPELKKEFENSLPLDLKVPKSSGAVQKDWKNSYFNMVPTIAAITILSKFENDVRNSEAMVVDYCLQQVGSVKLRFNTYTPIIGSSATYLLDGQELEITAGLGAFNSEKKPTVTINGQTIQIGSDNLARQKLVASGVGTKTVPVTVNYTDQDGNPKTVTQNIQYTVGSPTGITVTPEAVKVLYIGLENPISITGGTKGAESITPSISQGAIVPDKKGNGLYIATVDKPAPATITVKTSDGQVTNVAFKVKSVPNPTPMVGGSAGGRISINDFKAQVGLRADLSDFVFEGVKFDVIGYTIIGTGNGFQQTGPKAYENNGAYFEAEAKKIIDACKPGASVIFDRIKVRGPGGTRTLPQTVAFTLVN